MRTLKFFLLAFLFFSFSLQAQKRNKTKPEPQITITDSMFHNLKWRIIGLFRGGRSVASNGVVDQPHTFYMDSKLRLNDLHKDWKVYQDERGAIINTEMKAYNALYKSLEIPVLIFKD